MTNDWKSLKELIGIATPRIKTWLIRKGDPGVKYVYLEPHPKKANCYCLGKYGSDYMEFIGDIEEWQLAPQSRPPVPSSI